MLLFDVTLQGFLRYSFPPSASGVKISFNSFLFLYFFLLRSRFVLQNGLLVLANATPPRRHAVREVRCEVNFPSNRSPSLSTPTGTESQGDFFLALLCPFFFFAFKANTPKALTSVCLSQVKEWLWERGGAFRPDWAKPV